MMKTLSSLMIVSAVNGRFLHKRHDKATPPPGWSYAGRPTNFDSRKIEFTVALKQQNLEVLNKLFYEVSNPKHENYAQYLTREEVLALTAADPYDMMTVRNFLTNGGATILRELPDSLHVEMRVSDVEAMFETTMGLYKHNYHNAEYVSYITHVSLNDEKVSSAVDIIVGLELPFLPKKMGKPAKRIVQGSEASYTVVVPDTLFNQYNVDGRDTSYFNSGSSRNVVEFQESSQNPAFSKTDLSSFQAQMNLDQSNISNIVGSYDPANEASEANLDMQYITAFEPTTDTWYWTGTVWIYQWAQDVLSTPNAPLVHSISYGAPEVYQCLAIQGDCQNGETSAQYVNRTNVEFQKMGLQGMTVLVSSGDSGANGEIAQEDNCKHPAFWLQTDYPTSSPFVISVGATAMNYESISTGGVSVPACQNGQLTCIDSGNEVVCQQFPNMTATDPAQSLITSGGGFSNYSVVDPTNNWQVTAVSQFLAAATNLPPEGYYDPSHRAYPDVSALGHSYAVLAGDSYTPVDGTSASCPVMAGIISILNGHMLNNGGSPVGFANPLLYQMFQEQSDTFNDITSGDIRCTEMGGTFTEKVGCCGPYGYYAQPGYDLASGLGTPNVGNMLSYLDAKVLKL